MQLFWTILSHIYTDLYSCGLTISKPDILFNQPSKKLDCKWHSIIFADKTFDANERRLISNALEDLHYFCNGLVQFEIVFNLDANDEAFIKNHYVLIKAAEDHPVIKESDETYDCGVLGLCHYMTNNTRRIYLVSARLTNPITFRTTTVHELGHMISLAHTEQKSIMYKHNNSNVLYPTKIDAIEMASMWDVDVEDLRYFKL